jgi:hypothetical protein
MSKVSGEILINWLSSRFSTVSSTSATNRSTTREARMSWSWVVRPRGLRRLLGPLVARLGRRQQQTIWTGLKTQLVGSGPRPGIDRAVDQNRVDDLQWSDVVDGR